MSSAVSPAHRPRWRDPAALRSVAAGVIVVCGLWWMLGQLAAVIRPLLLAVFLCYVLLPWYSRMRRSGAPAWLTLLVIAGFAVSGLVVVVAVVTSNLIDLIDKLPEYEREAERMARAVSGWVTKHLPWLASSAPGQSPEATVISALGGVAQRTANQMAGGLLEAATAGLYLLFLMLGIERLPGRVRAAYSPERADHILQEAGRINAAIISYLWAKVKASLAIAVPVGLILAGFDVRFAALWAVLTFLCNFIPYIGSAVALALPVGFAFLQLPFGWQPMAVTGLLVACHTVCAAVVEPALIGRAVGLSPLIILAALAVWGQVWGLPGMFLAVPLTVVAKIVMENLDATRPVAKLIEG